MRGVARASLGIAGWKQDFADAVQAARDADAMTHASGVFYTYVSGIAFAMVRPDDTVLAHTAEAYEAATRVGEDIAVALCETSQGVALACQEGAAGAAGVESLLRVCERAADQHSTLTLPPIANCYVARARARLGEVKEAIELARATVDDLATAGSIWIVLATTVLVEALLTRGTDSDLDEADVAIDRLAAVPTDPGYVVNDIAVLRLRALLAQARGDVGRIETFGTATG
jgi:adenylate cyclase